MSLSEQTKKGLKMGFLELMDKLLVREGNELKAPKYGKLTYCKLKDNDGYLESYKTMDLWLYPKDKLVKSKGNRKYNWSFHSDKYPMKSISSGQFITLLNCNGKYHYFFILVCDNDFIYINGPVGLESANEIESVQKYIDSLSDFTGLELYKQDFLKNHGKRFFRLNQFFPEHSNNYNCIVKLFLEHNRDISNDKKIERKLRFGFRMKYSEIKNQEKKYEIRIKERKSKNRIRGAKDYFRKKLSKKRIMNNSL